MADMIQPERPERADVPDSEVVEPTHIGVARHRETRESFSPLDPQTPNSGLSAPTGPADRTAVESLRREAERLTSQGQPIEAPSILLGEPSIPRQEGGMPLKAKVGAVAGALAVAAGGFLGFNKIRSGDDGGERPGVIITDPTLKPTEPAPAFTPEATQIPEVTQAPEIKSTPYNFINQKEYLDGKLTLQAEENLPTMTEGPANIYPENFGDGKTATYYPSDGLEINPNHPESAENVYQGIGVGLLVAWSSQSDIPEEQKDLITYYNEPKLEQLKKLHLLKERASNGESFNLTLKAYLNDGFSDETVSIDLGEDYIYKIDQLSKPPVQLIFQSNFGGSLRISPANKEIRIEIFSPYRGAIGEFNEPYFLTNQVSTVVAYLDKLAVNNPDFRSNYKRGMDINELKNKNIAFGNRYFIVNTDENSNVQLWLQNGGAITPIK